MPLTFAEVIAVLNRLRKQHKIDCVYLRDAEPLRITHQITRCLCDKDCVIFAMQGTAFSAAAVEQCYLHYLPELRDLVTQYPHP